MAILTRKHYIAGASILLHRALLWTLPEIRLLSIDDRKFGGVGVAFQDTPKKFRADHPTGDCWGGYS